MRNRAAVIGAGAVPVSAARCLRLRRGCTRRTSRPTRARRVTQRAQDRHAACTRAGRAVRHQHLRNGENRKSAWRTTPSLHRVALLAGIGPLAERAKRLGAIARQARWRSQRAEDRGRLRASAGHKADTPHAPGLLLYLIPMPGLLATAGRALPKRGKKRSRTSVARCGLGRTCRCVACNGARGIAVGARPLSRRSPAPGSADGFRFTVQAVAVQAVTVQVG